MTALSDAAVDVCDCRTLCPRAYKCRHTALDRAECIHAEYLRRNLLHAGAIGARANIVAVLIHLRRMKTMPAWLITELEGIHGRVAPLAAELAQWRDMAPDAPK